MRKVVYYTGMGKTTDLMVAKKVGNYVAKVEKITPPKPMVSDKKKEYLKTHYGVTFTALV